MSSAPIPFASGRTSAASASQRSRAEGTRPQALSDLSDISVISDISDISQKGDIFVFLDLPPGAHVGCDTLVGTTSEESAQRSQSSESDRSPDKPEVTSFCGFRDIPPGAHFAWVSAPGALSRQGCWFIASRQGGSGAGAGRGTVRVKQWHRFHEVLADATYPDQGAPAAEGLAAVYSKLIPYGAGSSSGPEAPSTPRPRQGRYGDVENDVELWQKLTSCVTEPLLSRIAGSLTPPREWAFATTDTSKYEGAVPGQSSGHAEFSFLFAKDDLDAYRLIASREKNKDEKSAKKSTETDSASDSTDTTERLLALLEHPKSRFTEADIIGELQFAFLAGIVLSNLSCLEQWWHFILRIFLRARHLVARRPTLCRAFLDTLHAQLTYLERFTSSKVPRLSTRSGLISDSTESNDGAGDDGDDGDDGGGTSIFDAKPQGAVRLRASLSVFRQQFKFSKNDSKTNNQDAQVDERSVLSTSMAEASAAEAFMDLEALLWKYGWDLSGSRDEADNEADSGQGVGRRNHYRQENDEDDEVEIYDAPLNEGAQVGTRHANMHTALSDSDDDDDDDDYQPVIVEMDEDGREVGLVSWH